MQLFVLFALAAIAALVAGAFMVAVVVGTTLSLWEWVVERRTQRRRERDFQTSRAREFAAMLTAAGISESGEYDALYQRLTDRFNTRSRQAAHDQKVNPLEWPLPLPTGLGTAVAAEILPLFERNSDAPRHGTPLEDG